MADRANPHLQNPKRQIYEMRPHRNAYILLKIAEIRPKAQDNCGLNGHKVAFVDPTI